MMKRPGPGVEKLLGPQGSGWGVVSCYPLRLVVNALRFRTVVTSVRQFSCVVQYETHVLDNSNNPSKTWTKLYRLFRGLFDFEQGFPFQSGASKQSVTGFGSGLPPICASFPLGSPSGERKVLKHNPALEIGSRMNREARIGLASGSEVLLAVVKQAEFWRVNQVNEVCFP